MNLLYNQAEAEENHVLADKYEQVWKLLLSNLKEFQAVLLSKR